MEQNKYQKANDQILKYYNPPFQYDAESGGYVFDNKGQMVLEVRSWGMLCNHMPDSEAWHVQNVIGEAIAGLMNRLVSDEHAAKQLEQLPSPTSREGREWKEIASAPKDGAPILTCVAGEEYWPDKSWWDEQIEKWVINTNPITGKRVYITVSPTHWMPLPAPPSSTLP